MNSITFKYITLELIEKILRLKNYINKHSYNNRKNSNDAVIKIYEKSINTLLKNTNNLINDINLINDKSNSNEIFAIQRRLSTHYDTIKGLHGELHNLNSDWLKMETYTFVEQIQKKIFNDDKLQNLNIILSDDYTFVETNLDDRFKQIMEPLYDSDNTHIDGDSPTVIIPKIEYSNPLNWTILVHEIAHIDKKKIEKLISDSSMFPDNVTVDERNKLKNWAEEIYCDVKAIDVIGPAYFLSLASYALLQSLVTGFGVYSGSHPPFTMRLALLHSYIKNNSEELNIILPTKEEGSIHSFIHRMTAVVNENVKKMEGLPIKEPSINNLMIFNKYLHDALVMNGGESKDINPVFELVNNLKQSIPVGGFRVKDEDANELKKLREKTLTQKTFDEIKNTLSERNSELWEIINAGWVYKISEHIPFGINLFFNDESKTIDEKVKEYGDKIELLDDRLLVSIETSKLIDLIEN